MTRPPPDPALALRRWLMPPPTADGPLLFCFPYAGVGASSYRRWPRSIGDWQVVPLQPPGRENRMREEPHRSHAAFADDLADAITPLLDRGYAMAAHCGGAPFALDTIDVLAARGLPLPQRLVVSSWGAPQRGLYGHLNFADLDTLDLVAEVTDLFDRAGSPVRSDMAELAAQVLRTDLEVQRGYRFPAGRRVTCPVTVIAWTDDEVVAPADVPPGWDEVADVTHVLLPGKHLDFLGCPPPLEAGLREWLAPVSAREDAG